MALAGIHMCVCTTVPTNASPPHTHTQQQQDNNRNPAWSKLAAAVPRKILAPMTLAFATWQGMAGLQFHGPGSGLPLGTWGWGGFGWFGSVGEAYRITHIHTPLSPNPRRHSGARGAIGAGGPPLQRAHLGGLAREQGRGEPPAVCVVGLFGGGGVGGCGVAGSMYRIKGSSGPSSNWFALL